MNDRCRQLCGVVIVLAAVAALNSAAAQSPNTQHTYKLGDANSMPLAQLKDVAWLVGSWSGEAFGDKFEQVWNPPSAGSMMGMWKLLKGDRVAFYQLILLAEDEGSLSLKVKHFNEDFTAWEEKDEYVTFRLIKIDESAVHFSGLSFHRISENEMHGYLALHDEGKVREEKLVYRRRD